MEWLKHTGKKLQASDLEGNIREAAKKHHKVRKETLDIAFKKEKPGKSGSGLIPDIECYGYDSTQNILLGVRGNIEVIPLGKLEKMLPMMFGPQVDVDALYDHICTESYRHGQVSAKRSLGQGIHLIGDKWIIVSGKSAYSIDKKSLHKEELKELILDDKYLIKKSGDPWLDINDVKPERSLGFFMETFSRLKAIVSTWKWQNSEAASYITAFLMLSIFQQAMEPWRPLLYLSGAAGTGKSSFSRLLVNLFNGLPEVIDKTTPHALKQIFGDNSRPGFFDEFEHFESEKRQKDVINLFKSACSGGQCSYGTTGQAQKEIFFNHLFWVASICFPRCYESDKAVRDRLVVFELKKLKKKYLSPLDKEELKALGIDIINCMMGQWNKIEALVSDHLQEDSVTKQMELFDVESRHVENFVWAHSLIQNAEGKSFTDISPSIVPPWAIKKKEEDGDRMIQEILHTKVKDDHSEVFIGDLIQNASANFYHEKDKDSDEWKIDRAFNLLRLNHITVSAIGNDKEIHVGIQATKIGQFFENNKLFAGLDIKTIVSRLDFVSTTRLRFGGNSLTALIIPMKEINRLLGRSDLGTKILECAGYQEEGEIHGAS